MAARPGCAVLTGGREKDVAALRRDHLTTTKLLLAVLGAAATVGLVVLLFALSVRSVPGNSDGATVILEGKAIAAGHLSLRGWYLSYDSFWTSDAPVYAAAVLVTGVRGVLLNLVPAIIAAAVVVAGVAAVARGRRPAAAVAGGVTVVALLALPTPTLAFFLLQGPLHVCTALWCLGAMILVARRPSPVKLFVAALLLAAALDGDLQAAAFGVVPVAAGGLAAMARRRRWRSGAPAVSVAVASVVLALAAREVAKVFGTFTVNKSAPPASGHQMIANLSLVYHYSLQMLGITSNAGQNGGEPTVLADVHVVGVVFVAAGALVALVALVRGAVRGPGRAWDAADEDWRIDDMLVVAFVGALAVFVYLTPAADLSYARYLTAAVVFGALLAGRLVARVVEYAPSGAPAGVVGVGGLAVVACFAAGTGFTLREPPVTQAATQLGQYLLAHGLRTGIGDYWSSSIVTVESGGQDVIRPVTAELSRRVVSYTRNSSATWYTGKSFQFLVFNALLPFGGVDASTARATFGAPSRSVVVDGYEVLTWRHPISVVSGTSRLASVSPPS